MNQLSHRLFIRYIDERDKWGKFIGHIEELVTDEKGYFSLKYTDYSDKLFKKLDEREEYYQIVDYANVWNDLHYQIAVKVELLGPLEGTFYHQKDQARIEDQAIREIENIIIKYQKAREKVNNERKI